MIRFPAELLPWSLNVLNLRVATREERAAGRCCVECIRSSWPAQIATHQGTPNRISPRAASLHAV